MFCRNYLICSDYKTEKCHNIDTIEKCIANKSKPETNRKTYSPDELNKPIYLKHECSFIKTFRKFTPFSIELVLDAYSMFGSEDRVDYSSGDNGCYPHTPIVDRKCPFCGLALKEDS